MISIIQIASIVLVLTLLAAGIVFVVRRFSYFSLRIKLLILLLAVALIPISVLIFINNISTRNALTSVANQSLSIVAKQTADEIDGFILEAIDTLEKEAELDFFRSALVIEPRDFTTIEKEVSQAMQVLVERNPDSITTYALLNREGEYITGYPKTNRQIPAFLGLNPILVNGLQIALVANLPYVSPVVLDPETNQANLYVSVRVNSEEGEILGLLIAAYDASILQTIIEESNDAVGKNSYGILVDEHNVHLAHGYAPVAIFKSMIPLNDALLQRLKDSNRLPNLPVNELTVNYPELENGLRNSRQEPFFSLEPGPAVSVRSVAATERLKTRPWVVTYIQPQDIFLQAADQQTQFFILLGILFGAITAIGAFGASRIISEPISELSQAVEQISSGNFNIQTEVSTRDEIGKLATAFNTMTTQIKNLLGGLESQVEERTRELERRAVQIQTAAEVARDASQIQDLDILLDHTCNLINQRFGFYHIGLFLLDEQEEYAVLRASNSEGGNLMLDRGHKLKVGEVGIVGDTAKSGQPHIALDVGEDAIHFSHPYLPETRSEMALPLLIRKRVIGVLDVQSTIAGAFDQEDVNILQILADQLAVAIQNSQLITEIQARIRELRAAYGDYTRRTWREWASNTRQEGFFVQGDQVLPVTSSPPEVAEAWGSKSLISQINEDKSSLAIPIQLRGNTLGVIHMRMDSSQITEDFTNLIQEIGDRLALALDNAQLFETSQKRAAQEQLIGGITSKMRETLDVQTVLSTAVKEIRDALELFDIAVELELPELNQ